MNKIYVSPSRLKTFLDCKWQYYCKYHLRLPDESSPKALVGSAIHEIFELLFGPKKQDKRKKYIFHSVLTGELHPVIIKLFIKFTKKYKIPQFDKKDLDLYAMGKELMLKTFLRGYQPNIVLDVEKAFEIPLTDKVWIRGYIDRVSEIDKDTLELTDYKSGQPFSQETCEKEFQPFFYIIAAKKLYPQYKNFLFNFHFLKNKKIVSVPLNEEKLSKFTNFIISQGIYMLNFDEKSAIPNKSFKCDVMCAFKNPIKASNYKGCPGYYK